MILAFLANIWTKFQGWIASAFLVLIMVWYIFTRGKKEAKKEAEIKDLKEEVTVAKTIAKAVTDDAKVVAEVEKTVDALPDHSVAERARKWVRDKT